jgi:hypothetical protein
MADASMKLVVSWPATMMLLAWPTIWWARSGAPVALFFVATCGGGGGAVQSRASRGGAGFGGAVGSGQGPSHPSMQSVLKNRAVWSAPRLV